MFSAQFLLYLQNIPQEQYQNECHHTNHFLTGRSQFEHGIMPLNNVQIQQTLRRETARTGRTDVSMQRVVMHLISGK